MGYDVMYCTSYRPHSGCDDVMTGSVQVSNPRGCVRLLPTGWCKTVPQGTPRMTDAVAKLSDANKRIVTVVSCSLSPAPPCLTA